MRYWTKIKSIHIKLETALAWCIGLGLATFPIHNAFQPFKEYFFLPLVGFAFLMASVILYVFKVKKFDWGSPWVFVPMLVIVFSGLARALVYFTSHDLSNAAFLVTMLVLYLASRRVGAGIFKILIPFVIIEAISVIVYGVITPGQITGGLAATPKTAEYDAGYNLAVGYLVYGAFLIRGKWQWPLIILCAIALLFTGSAEGLFVMAVIGIVILIRHDWGKKLWLTGLALGVLTLALIGGGLYWRAVSNVEALPDAASGDAYAISVALSGRMEAYQAAFNELAPIGHGMEIGHFNNRTVHNVPLIIIDQLGIPAGIAWLVIVFYCLCKTKWKYAWIAVLAMSVFDHFIWTQYHPFWWVLAGVSTISVIDNDFIFRSKHEVKA